jgi:hypothetical protein
VRYFNATQITRREAKHIRSTYGASGSSIVVISIGSRWFDVRLLTEKELRGFVEQLLREERTAGRGSLH